MPKKAKHAARETSTSSSSSSSTSIETKGETKESDSPVNRFLQVGRDVFKLIANQLSFKDRVSLAPVDKFSADVVLEQKYWAAQLKLYFPELYHLTVARKNPDFKKVLEKELARHYYDLTPVQRNLFTFVKERANNQARGIQEQDNSQKKEDVKREVNAKDARHLEQERGLDPEDLPKAEAPAPKSKPKGKGRAKRNNSQKKGDIKREVSAEDTRHLEQERSLDPEDLPKAEALASESNTKDKRNPKRKAEEIETSSTVKPSVSDKQYGSEAGIFNPKLSPLTFEDLDIVDDSGTSLFELAKQTQNQALLDHIYSLAQAYYKTEKSFSYNKLDAKKRKLLNWALQCRQPAETIRELVKKTEIVHDNKRTAAPNANDSILCDAVDYGSVALYKSIFEKHCAEVVVEYNPIQRQQEYYERAAKGGHLELLKELEKIAVPINRVNALNHASKHKQLDVIKHLASLTGFNVNATFNGNNTALHHAAKNGDLTMVKYLLSNGANITLYNNDGECPLRIAAKSGYFDVFQEILNHHRQMIDKLPSRSEAEVEWGIETEPSSSSSSSSLSRTYSTAGKPKDVLYNTLYAYGDSSGILFTAAKEGFVDIVVYLLELHDKLPHCVDESLLSKSLHLMIKYEHGYAFQELLKNRVPDQERRTALVNRKYGAEQQTLFSIAAHAADVASLRFLLDNGATVTPNTESFSEAVEAAVKQGDLPLLKILLAKLSVTDRLLYINSMHIDETLLYTAAKKGQGGVVVYLLGQGAHINIAIDDNLTALYAAVEYNQPRVVELLLDRINLQMTLPQRLAILNADYRGEKLLGIAARNGSTEIIDMLLDQGAHLGGYGSNGMTALCMAVKNGHFKAYRHLLELTWGSGATLAEKAHIVNQRYGSEGYSLLHLATLHNRQDIALDLLTITGIDINLTTTSGRTALHLAALKKRRVILELLLNNNARVDVLCDDGNNALAAAVRNLRYDAVELMIKTLKAQKGDINVGEAQGCSPFFTAIKLEKRQIAGLLISNGARVNGRTRAKRTALHIAAQEKVTPATMKYLLHLGLDVNAKCAKGRTPLYVVAKQTNTESLHNVLIKADATVTAACKDGSTALHAAAESGNVKALTVLAHKMDTNTARHDGATAMHVAAMSGCVDVIKPLADHKANLNATFGEDNLTPLKLAAEHGHLSMMTQLLAWGATPDINAWKIAADNEHDDLVEYYCEIYGKGMNPLMFHAVHMDGSTSLEELCESYDIDATDDNGMTALMLAAQAGQYENVKTLLSLGANPKLTVMDEEGIDLQALDYLNNNGLAYTPEKHELTKLLAQAIEPSYDTPSAVSRTPSYSPRFLPAPKSGKVKKEEKKEILHRRPTVKVEKEEEQERSSASAFAASYRSSKGKAEKKEQKRKDQKPSSTPATQELYGLSNGSLKRKGEEEDHEIGDDRTPKVQVIQ